MVNCPSHTRAYGEAGENCGLAPHGWETTPPVILPGGMVCRLGWSNTHLPTLSLLGVVSPRPHSRSPFSTKRTCHTQDPVPQSTCLPLASILCREQLENICRERPAQGPASIATVPRHRDNLLAILSSHGEGFLPSGSALLSVIGRPFDRRAWYAAYDQAGGLPLCCQGCADDSTRTAQDRPEMNRCRAGFTRLILPLACAKVGLDPSFIFSSPSPSPYTLTPAADFTTVPLRGLAGDTTPRVSQHLHKPRVGLYSTHVRRLYCSHVLAPADPFSSPAFLLLLLLPSLSSNQVSGGHTYRRGGRGAGCADGGDALREGTASGPVQATLPSRTPHPPGHRSPLLLGHHRGLNSPRKACGNTTWPGMRAYPHGRRWRTHGLRKSRQIPSWTSTAAPCGK